MHVYGSANLVQTLLKHDLVNALWLFRSKRKLWTYSGLGIKSHDSPQSLQRIFDSVRDNLEPSSACGVLFSALLACLHDFGHIPRWANLENVAVRQRRVLADELYSMIHVSRL